MKIVLSYCFYLYGSDDLVLKHILNKYGLDIQLLSMVEASNVSFYPFPPHLFVEFDTILYLTVETFLHLTFEIISLHLNVETIIYLTAENYIWQ